jgi:hypothetical protein
MQSATQAEIKNRIASFVAELDLMVRKGTLEALHGILGNGAGVPARRGRPAGGGRGPGRPKGSGRRSSANVDEAAAKILSHVQANDGQGISAIADATGVDLKTAKKAAIRMLASGQLKKSGQKRGTVYHVGSGRPARAAKAGKRGKRGRKAKRGKKAA